MSRLNYLQVVYGQKKAILSCKLCSLLTDYEEINFSNCWAHGEVAYMRLIYENIFLFSIYRFLYCIEFIDVLPKQSNEQSTIINWFIIITSLWKQYE